MCDRKGEVAKGRLVKRDVAGVIHAMKPPGTTKSPGGGAKWTSKYKF